MTADLLSNDVIMVFVLRRRPFCVGAQVNYKPRMYVYKHISVEVTGYKVETTVL
jgi:hypothetical protein